MREKDSESFEESRISQDAAEWVAKRLRGFASKEQDDFFDWLAKDPRHGEWYSRHMKTWKQLDLLAQWKPEHSDKPNQDLLKHRQVKSRFGAIAAVLAFGIFVWAAMQFPSREPIPQDLVAKEYESHVLPDGTTVEMNQGAALKVNYTPDVRGVELVSSEAHFEVTKDPERPFVVRARGVDIQAVGTAFNVRLADEAVELLVTEGRVLMSALDSKKAGEAAETYKYQEEVVAGQLAVASLEVEAAPPEAVEIPIEHINELLAWKSSLLEFDEVPLSKVITEFNRRNVVQLEIGDTELGAMPIVASFRSADVRNFVNMLELTMDVRAEQLDEQRIRLRLP